MELALWLACALAVIGALAARRHALSWLYRAPIMVLGMAALAAAVALPLALPVFRFPSPSGPHEIGTFTYHRVDASRADIFNADPTERRQLMVQIWYPALADATSWPSTSPALLRLSSSRTAA